MQLGFSQMVDVILLSCFHVTFTFTRTTGTSSAWEPMCIVQTHGHIHKAHVRLLNESYRGGSDVPNDTLELRLQCQSKSSSHLRISFPAKEFNENFPRTGITKLHMCVDVHGAYNGKDLKEVCFTLDYSGQMQLLTCWLNWQFDRAVIIRALATISNGISWGILFGNLHVTASKRKDNRELCKESCDENLLSNISSRLSCENLYHLNTDNRLQILDVRFITFSGHLVPLKLLKNATSVRFSLQCFLGGPGELEVYFENRGSFCRIRKLARMFCYVDDLPICANVKKNDKASSKEKDINYMLDNSTKLAETSRQSEVSLIVIIIFGVTTILGILSSAIFILKPRQRNTSARTNRASRNTETELGLLRVT